MYESGDHWRNQTIPVIRLAGKWLRETGINPGDYITVKVYDGRLVIDKEVDNDNER